MDLASAYVLRCWILLGPVFQSSMGQNQSRENGGIWVGTGRRVRVRHTEF